MTELHDFTHAVVMGDVVASRRAPSVAGLFNIFNQAIADANIAYAETLASPLTITLGDEFQGLCSSLNVGLSVIRRIRRTLLDADVECRFVLGLVRIETPLNAEKAWNMMGPGLAEAREKLVTKHDRNAYRFSTPGYPVTEQLLDAIGSSLSEIEAGWTRRQKDVVGASLDHQGPDAQLAHRLGTGPRSLYKIRSAAHFEVYRTQWMAVAAALEHFDRGHGLP